MDDTGTEPNSPELEVWTKGQPLVEVSKPNKMCPF